MIAENHPKLVFVPIAKAIVPQDGMMFCYKHRWWVTRGDCLVFWDKKAMAPQCNQNEAVIDHTIRTMYPWGEKKFIEMVFQVVRA